MPAPAIDNGRPEQIEPFDYVRNPNWRIFRIMAEFVDGFTFLSGLKKTVTFFGSARFELDSHHCSEAKQLAGMLARAGFTIITGGGGGIMQAGNQGASEAGGGSVGLNIEIKDKQRTNPYVKKSIAFYHFFVRKVMLDYSAQAYVFFPGGFGTLDEFFELITLIQTKKISSDIPVVLVGRDYWGSLTKWIHDEVYERHQTIKEKDLDIWHLVGSVEEAFEIIQSSKERQLDFPGSNN